MSIAYVAVENLISGGPQSLGAGILFGLVHGFGFAGVLTEIGLPTRGLVGVTSWLLTSESRSDRCVSWRPCFR